MSAGFRADLERKPVALARLAATLRAEDPWKSLRAPRRVVLLGMGSSGYAAGVAAARLRARGLVATAERASSELLPDWGPGTLVVAISASGRSREVSWALDRMTGSYLVALTNTPDSPVGDRCARVVDMGAGVEEGGVACRSYQHTLALLLALEAHLTGRSTTAVADLVDRAAEPSADLLRRAEQWLPAVCALLDGPAGAHLVAPARRLSSAQQGALMLREVPRTAAVACEAGDWAHVDVYLTKNTDYRLMAFAGSVWDDGILEWTRPRRTRVAAVGGSLDGAELTVRYAFDEDDDVRLLSEVLVPEVAAAELGRTGR